MKQIQIYELLPLLRQGFVAMDKDKSWYWYANEPEIDIDSYTRWIVNSGPYINLSDLFDIAPFEDDWEYSLMECGK